MNEQKPDIVEQYFKAMEQCNSMSCRKVIFEPSMKREWFYEEDCWCYFEFLCEDMDYRLVKTQQKIFDDNCMIRDMSYEIKMLLNYYHLRGTVTIGKELLSTYIVRFEKARELEPSLTAEKYNFDLKLAEEKALKSSDKIANRILWGCLSLICIIIVLFGLFVLSVFFAPKAEAKSKYSQTFIQNFYQCKPYSESKYNTAYNSNSTYEIKGYAQDGSGKCIYVETNRWLRGTNITTCYFDSKNQREYLNAMFEPDKQASVLVKGMPVVGKNEDVTYLKYFNDPKVCETKAVHY